VNKIIQLLTDERFVLLTFGVAIGALLFILTGGWGGVLG
jgi:hypothetical protein